MLFALCIMFPAHCQTKGALGKNLEYIHFICPTIIF